MSKLSNEQLATAKQLLKDVNASNKDEKSLLIVVGENYIEFFSKIENAKTQNDKNGATLWLLELGANEAKLFSEETNQVIGEENPKLKSDGMKADEAVTVIASMTDVDVVKAFVDGEKRTTVVRASEVKVLELTENKSL